MKRRKGKKTKRQRTKRVLYCDVRAVSHSCDVLMLTNSVLLADSSERRGLRKGEGGFGRRGLPITRSIDIKVIKTGSCICKDNFFKSSRH